MLHCFNFCVVILKKKREIKYYSTLYWYCPLLTSKTLSFFNHVFVLFTTDKKKIFYVKLGLFVWYIYRMVQTNLAPKHFIYNSYRNISQKVLFLEYFRLGF